MRAKVYNSLKEFEDDLKWFDYFCRVERKSSSAIVQSSKELLTFVKGEALSIQACEECFLNAYEHGVVRGFVIPCKSPHIMLWARMQNYCYWPSKAMWVEDTLKLVNVRFFGDHTTATLPAGNCMMYSKDHPTLDGKFSEALQHAMQVSLCIHRLLSNNM